MSEPGCDQWRSGGNPTAYPEGWSHIPARSHCRRRAFGRFLRHAAVPSARDRSLIDGDHRLSRIDDEKTDRVRSGRRSRHRHDLRSRPRLDVGDDLGSARCRVARLSGKPSANAEQHEDHGSHGHKQCGSASKERYWRGRPTALIADSIRACHAGSLRWSVPLQAQWHEVYHRHSPLPQRTVWDHVPCPKLGGLSLLRSSPPRGLSRHAVDPRRGTTIADE